MNELHRVTPFNTEENGKMDGERTYQPTDEPFPSIINHLAFWTIPLELSIPSDIRKAFHSNRIDTSLSRRKGASEIQ